MFPRPGIRHIVSIGAAVVLVPIILNYGFGYISTVERIGNGEDVAPTAMQDAVKDGIPPGQTQQEAERVLGSNSTPVASDTPGTTCRGYPFGKTRNHLVVCYKTVGSDGNEQFIVTDSRVAAGKLG